MITFRKMQIYFKCIYFISQYNNLQSFIFIVEVSKNAVMFDVEAGDYYGTGRLPSHREGMFLVVYEFNTGSAR